MKKIKSFFNKKLFSDPRKKYMLIISIVSMILVIGASYALITSNLFTGQKQNIISGILDINFTQNSALIDLSAAIPMTDEDGMSDMNTSYEFTISNVGSVDANYYIKIIDETTNGNKLDIGYIRYSIKIGDNEWSVPLNLYESELGRTLWSDSLNTSSNVSIKLKLWIDIDAPNSIMGKTFSGKIKVESIQLVEGGFQDINGPTITINGNQIVNVVKDDTYTDAGVSSITDENDNTLTTRNIVTTIDYFDGTNYTKVKKVNTANIGTYFITYSAKNLGGIVGSVTRIVNVNTTNSSLPTVTRTGNNNIVIMRGTLYADEGSTAATSGDTSLTSSIVTSNHVNIGVPGTYVVKYAVKDTATNNFAGETRIVKVFYSSFTFTYTGNYQLFEVPFTGYYNVELWGAGQDANFKGGYSNGTIMLTTGEKLYVYVGSRANGINGGWNGGGNSGTFNSSGLGGSGATDVRYFAEIPDATKLVWNSVSGLNARIMVAAGSPGGVAYPEAFGQGGGLSGTGSYRTGYEAYKSYGGTQLIGGAGVALYPGTTASTAGTFGIGGTGGQSSVTGYGGGGGGGYYGGGGGSGAAEGAWAGGGGSSFISGYAGVNAIDKTSNIKHTNNTIHYSEKYFVNPNMIPGINDGNGKAKITYIGTSAPAKITTKLNSVRYIKDCINGSSTDSDNSWVELQAIYKGKNIAKGIIGKLYNSSNNQIKQRNNTAYAYANATDGLFDNIESTSGFAQGATTTGNQCFVLDLGKTYDLDEIAVWHYWIDDRTYNNNITSVSSDNSTWTTVMNKQIIETSQGKRINAYKEITLTINPTDGTWNGSTGVRTYKLAPGETVVIPDPTLENDVFKNWTKTGGADATLTDQKLIVGYNNVSLTATWYDTFTITYDLAGGILENGNPERYTAIDNIILNNPTKPEYDFVGWTGSNGTTPQTNVNIAIGSSGDKSYVANWTKSCDINMDNTITYNPGDTLTISGNTWKVIQDDGINIKLIKSPVVATTSYGTSSTTSYDTSSMRTAINSDTYTTLTERACGKVQDNGDTIILPSSINDVSVLSTGSTDARLFISSQTFTGTDSSIKVKLLPTVSKSFAKINGNAVSLITIYANTTATSNPTKATYGSKVSPTNLPNLDTYESIGVTSNLTNSISSTSVVPSAIGCYGTAATYITNGALCSTWSQGGGDVVYWDYNLSTCAFNGTIHYVAYSYTLQCQNNVSTYTYNAYTSTRTTYGNPTTFTTNAYVAPVIFVEK